MREHWTRGGATFLLVVGLAGCGNGNESASSPTGPSASTSAQTPAPSPGASTCATTVAGLPNLIPATSGRYSFSIAAAAGCPWTAQTDAVWAEILPNQGQGNASPMLQVTENANVNGRGVTVTIGSQQFRISQSGNCTFSVSPTSLEEGPGEGTPRITLNTGGGCAWTATSSESWVRVLSSSGTGPASIGLELAENRADVRHAFLTIAGIRVPVTQRAR